MSDGTAVRHPGAADAGGAGGLDALEDFTTGSHQVATVVVASVVLSGGIRAAGVCDDHVNSLADVDAELPPIVVHRPTMRVIDGAHRVLAARRRGVRHIRAVFFDGDENAAFLLAVRLNVTHGMPLSRADRTAAAARVVRSHPQWSDRRVALVTGLSDKTIAGIRRSCAEVPRLNDRIGRDGRVRPLTAAAGRLRASDVLSRKPNATLREIAQEAGISLGTARDVRRRLQAGENPVPARGDPVDGVRPVTGPADHPEPGDTAAAPFTVPPPEEATALLENLRRDPSLRYTDAGRTVLRLLSVPSISMADWHRLIGSIPAHTTSSVAQLARASAGVWLQFARTLEGEPPHGIQPQAAEGWSRSG